MLKKIWQPENPFNQIVFDCDGTLSAIEGIDELAEKRGVKDVVSALTAAAMGQLGLSKEIYQQRLDLVKPTKAEVEKLGEAYFAHRVMDILEVIQIYHRLQKKVYIISGGLLPAIIKFADALQIDNEKIFAVDIKFDAAGNYLEFDTASPLVTNQGKCDVISQIKLKDERVLYVGDGLNDVVAGHLAERFVGYGGVFYRENIAELCEYYIACLSLSALLPLSLTQAEYESLTATEKLLYAQGEQAISQNYVRMK